MAGVDQPSKRIMCRQMGRSRGRRVARHAPGPLVIADVTRNRPTQPALPVAEPVRTSWLEEPSALHVEHLTNLPNQCPNSERLPTNGIVWSNTSCRTTTSFV